MLLEGTIINGTIVLDGNEQLPEGARVEVALKKQESNAIDNTEKRLKAASPLGEALMQLAGTAVGLTEDMAARQDYYLMKARCNDGSSVELTFADGFVACLTQSQLGLADGEVDLRTAETTAAGLAINPTKGGRFVIDSETLRYVADPTYAAKVDQSIRDLHLSPTEAKEAATLSTLTRDPRWNDVGDEDDLFE